MSATETLIKGLLEGDGGFKEALRYVLKEELGTNVHEFSARTKISQSTIYKILSEDREPNLKTVRKIINAVRKIEGSKVGNFIAVIATRPVLDRIVQRTVEVEGKGIVIREYPSHSIEEAIISAVRAEREGAVAVVCAPIVSATIEKILRIPVATIMPENSVIRAIKLAAKKAMIR